MQACFTVQVLPLKAQVLRHAPGCVVAPQGLAVLLRRGGRCAVGVYAADYLVRSVPLVAALRDQAVTQVVGAAPLRDAPGHVVVRLQLQRTHRAVRLRVQAVMLIAQGELHLQQVPGAVAQELQLPPVREGGGAPGAIKIHL